MNRYRVGVALCAVAVAMVLSSCVWGYDADASRENQYMYLSADALFVSSNTTSTRAESSVVATFTVETNGLWSVVLDEGANFTVSPMSGYANAITTVTVTTSSSNSTSAMQSLGGITIRRDDGYVSDQRVEVQQRRVPTMATLAYFVGTDLAYYYNNNINNMKAAVARGDMGEQGSLVVYKHSTESVAALYELVEHNGSCYEVAIKSYSGSKALNSGVLSGVIEDVKSDLGLAADAKMNMVVSSHGTGWVPYGVGVLRSTSDDQQGQTSYADMWAEKHRPAGGALVTRYIGCEKDSYTSISGLVEELQASGSHFGYILFDACLMSNIETLYRLKDNVDYVVASPAEVMGDGFPYYRIMPYMFTDNGTSFDPQGICEAYVDYYKYTAYYPYGTVAYCNTSKLEALATAMKSMSLSTLEAAQRSAIQSYEGLASHVYYDLEDYVTTAAGNEVDLTDFTAALEAAFPVDGRLHTTYFYSGLNWGSPDFGIKRITSYSGVSTSQPSTLYTTQWNAEPWAIAIGKTK